MYANRLNGCDERLLTYIEDAISNNASHANLMELLGIRKEMRLMDSYDLDPQTGAGGGAGGGTTAIACIKERRHFIGFELSKEYFDKAVRRIKAEQAQLTFDF